MSGKTKIEWADRTWSPLIGCQKVSEGCKNCYAERVACSMVRIGMSKSYWSDYIYCIAPDKNGKPERWNGESVFRRTELTKPRNWKTPSLVFVCSMSDLFFEKHDFEHIKEVFDIMRKCTDHKFLILTKRPERLLQFAQYSIEKYGMNLLDGTNLWYGVTAENQEMADKRIPILLKAPVNHFFVSVEPMLSEVDLTSYLFGMNSLQWVICGAESGPNEVRRSMKVSWARLLKDQCLLAGVPFFFKQAYVDGVRTHMPQLDGKIWDQKPHELCLHQPK
jgi:protein gp37